jgi:hypothetical protein
VKPLQEIDIEKNRERNNTTQASQFLVIFITAMEVFLKKIVSLNPNWNDNGYTEILNQKITLSEAYKMIGKERVTQEFIVAQYVSFSNYDSINSVFSKLVGTEHFIEDLGKHVMIWAKAEEKILFDTCLDEMQPDWKDKIKEAYKRRNEFVHEGVTHPDALTFSLQLFSIAIKFGVAFISFMIDKFPKEFNRSNLGSDKLV